MTRSRITIKYPDRRIKSVLASLITAALEAGDPQKAIRRTLVRKGKRLEVGGAAYDLARFHRIVCVGAGKASGNLAIALEHILGGRLEDGLVIVKDGYGVPCQKIRLVEAAHPVPDRRGMNATRHILSLAQSLTRDDLLMVLLSGGASSLLCAPSPGLRLIDKQRTNRLLLQSGAPIHDINVVRKHLSAVKGGGLAVATKATVLTLILSDVPKDDPATIGSGPTVPDPSTFQDAKDILMMHKIWSKVPAAVRRHLQNGLAGRIPETLKPTRTWTRRHRHLVLANNGTAREGIANAARRLNLKTVMIPDFLQGEAKEIGDILGNIAADLIAFGNPVSPPICLIAGGEPTVTVTGSGKGGRAQECVLAASLRLAGLRKAIVAGFGTDGTDGPTDVAGALVDGKTIERALRKGLDPAKVLRNHDSYHFFKEAGGHIITGPTGTNINDIYLIVAW
jgi:glycerate 2-kinase